MTLQYIDLSDRHGHRDDHGFQCGAEFNVKTRRRIDIPDFVREQLSPGVIDTIWWEEAAQARDTLRDALLRRYKWVGDLAFVGRGPGWLAIEDTACKRRNWDTIAKMVEASLKAFIKTMESPAFWRDVRGIEPAGKVSGARKKSAGQERIAYWVRSRGGPRSSWDIVPVYVLGTTTRADEGLIGHDLRVRPLRLGKGPYTAVVSPDDVEDKP